MAAHYTQQIYWVNGTGKQAKRDARTHLMRELSRKRQWAKDTVVTSVEEVKDQANEVRGHQDVLILAKPSSPPSNSHSRPISPESLGSDDHPSLDTSSSSTVSLADPRTPNGSESPPMQTSPICPLQSNKDPFNAFPSSEFNTSLCQELFNAISFKTICAEIWNLKETASFNPLRDIIYPVSAQDPAAFGAFVSMTANVRSRYTPGRIDAAAYASKLHSIQSVNQRMKKGELEALTDGTLVAVFGLAVLEAQFGDQRACTAHGRGLQRLLLQRGRLDEISKQLQLYFGVCSALSYPKSFTIASMSTSSNPKYSSAEVSEPNMELRIEELIEFTRAVQKCSTSPCSVLGKRSNTYKARMFLHRTISRSSKKRFGQDRSLRYQDQCRFGALAYVHLTVLEHQRSPAALERELKDMVEQLRGHKAHIGVSSDILVWLVNQYPGMLRVRNFERTWTFNRFMSVIKRLTDEALLDLNDYLFDTLEGKTVHADVIRNLWKHPDTWMKD